MLGLQFQCKQMKGLSEIKEKQLNAVLLMLDGNNESDTDSEKKCSNKILVVSFFLAIGQ